MNRDTWLKLVTVIVSLLVCVVVLELLVRFVYHRKLDYQIEMSRYAAQLKRKSPDARQSHEHIPGTGATLMGVPVSINSHGFRDRERPVHKPDGVYRILLLGDSLTFGWGAKQEDRFSDLLEEFLNQEFRKKGLKTVVEVVNTGIGNYNTAQEVALFEQKGRPWKPDMVIVNYFINDAEPTPTKVSPWIFKYSQLAMWLWGRMDVISRRFGNRPTFEQYYQGLYNNHLEGWRNAKEALRRLGDMAKQQHFVFVVAILPELHAVGKVYRFQSVNDLVTRAALDAGAAQVIDLAPYFSKENPPELWVSPDDAHPNARAHMIMASGIFENLKRKGWFDGQR